MPDAKPPKRKRTHVLPVRVESDGRSPGGPTHPASAPEPEPTRRVRSGLPAVETETRRRVALVGIVTVLIGVVVLWAFTVGTQLTQSRQSDSLIVRIRASLRSVFSNDDKTPRPVSEEEQQFEALDERLFPDVPE